MKLNEISDKHHKWLEEMGWVGKLTTIELLMLVVGECGEAANEVRGEAPTEKFKHELADIILRTLGIAKRYNIDIEKAIEEKMAINVIKGTQGRIK